MAAFANGHLGPRRRYGQHSNAAFQRGQLVTKHAQARCVSQSCAQKSKLNELEQIVFLILEHPFYL